MEFKGNLDKARPLSFESGVVRLEQDILAEADSVVLVFQVDGDGQTFTSAPLRMGPAAPEGTGWVGVGDLDWQVDVSPGDSFTVRVLDSSGKDTLLELNYPSLAERVGPAGLARPRRGNGGSLVFRTEDRWWREVLIPDIL